MLRTKTIALGSWPISDRTSNFKDISLTEGIWLSMLVEVWSSSVEQPLSAKKDRWDQAQSSEKMRMAKKQDFEFTVGGV
ncbi:hypothetical protein AgCh_022578 [Apium graveolens]